MNKYIKNLQTIWLHCMRQQNENNPEKTQFGEVEIVTSYKTRGKKRENGAFVSAKWMVGLRSVTKEFTGVIMALC